MQIVNCDAKQGLVFKKREGVIKVPYSVKLPITR